MVFELFTRNFLGDFCIANQIIHFVQRKSPAGVGPIRCIVAGLLFGFGGETLLREGGQHIRGRFAGFGNPADSGR